jgi:hypothetical protein
MAQGGLPNASASELQAQVVSLCWQLAVLGSQVPALTPLVSQLQTLIVGFEGLNGADPAVSSLLAQLQRVSDLPATSGSVLTRAMLLEHLLARLIQADPVAASRLAPALPALHVLLGDLPFVSTPAGDLGVVQPKGIYGGTASVLPSLAWAALDGLRLGGVPAALPAPDVVAQPSVRNRQSVENARARPSRRAAVTASSQAASPDALTPPRDGIVASSSGGIGSAAPAAVALLVVLTAWLVDAVIGGRLRFDLKPPRATLLAARLERPG